MKCDELIETVAGSLETYDDDFQGSNIQLPENLQTSYRYFLSLCDGGYTKDHFIHFFGQNGARAHNVAAWNNPRLWKHYFGLDDKVFCFAEDIFGTQFCFDIRGNRRVVKTFVPETEDMVLTANTFEEFLEGEVLDDRHNADLRQLSKSVF